jgi:hypothetical protein
MAPRGSPKDRLRRGNDPIARDSTVARKAEPAGEFLPGSPAAG